MLVSMGAPQWKAFAVAVALAAGCFLLEGRLSLGLSDEGFLWYGVQQASRGQIPLRDFQAYDPGRYYWCAAAGLLFGKGLVAVRAAEALAQALGLWAGLLAASGLTQRVSLLAAIGVMLALWMFPSHKLFDHTLLLISILVAVRLIEKPSSKRILVTGGFVGFCTFFGRNHALYNLVATGGLLLLLCWKDGMENLVPRICLWIAGIVVGSLPLLLMMLFVPGFSAAYLDSILSVFRNGPNLGLPVPWYLFALPAFYGLTITLACRMSGKQLKENALFCACGFIGIAYMHHAFARADFSHLAQAIHPLTLGVCSAIVHVGLRWIYLWVPATVLSAVAVIGGGGQRPLYQRLISRDPWVDFETGETIFVRVSYARLFDCLQRFTEHNLRPQEKILIAPYTPGLYPILHRTSPVWELYFFFPASVKAQEKDIQLLVSNKVNWALISSSTLDQREDLRFSVTHPLLWQYLREHFEKVPLPCLPRAMELLHRREPLQD